MPNQVVYPLDLTGVAPSNYIQGELHTVNEGVNRSYYFIVPNFAPFFIDNFSMTITVNGVTSPLTEDVDYNFVLSYVTGTRTTGKAMYGGVSVHNLNLNGILTLNYQTVGGEQIADRLQVLTMLADRAYNPRTCIFDILSGVPQAFPPVPHFQDYENFFGQEEVVNMLGQIRDAILQNSSLTATEISNFLELIGSSNLASFLKKTGDTMTGALTLDGPPILPLHATTKEYVDSTTISANELADTLSGYYNGQVVDGMVNQKVNRSGDTLTGPLVLASNPTEDMHAVNKAYVDSADDSINDQLVVINGMLSNLSSDNVTKQYVDDRINEVMAYINTVLLKG